MYMWVCVWVKSHPFHIESERFPASGFRLSPAQNHIGIAHLAGVNICGRERSFDLTCGARRGGGRKKKLRGQSDRWDARLRWCFSCLVGLIWINHTRLRFTLLPHCYCPTIPNLMLNGLIQWTSSDMSNDTVTKELLGFGACLSLCKSCSLSVFPEELQCCRIREELQTKECAAKCWSCAGSEPACGCGCIVQ